jgi:hypothetical protein
MPILPFYATNTYRYYFRIISLFYDKSIPIIT